MSTPDLTLEAVILAAGRSRRAATFKPAFEIGGKPLLRHAAERLLHFCRRVVVVTGHEHERCAELVAGLDGVVTTFNPDHAGDMFLSVQTGAAAVTAACNGFFILPVDCPFPSAAALATLRDAFVEADHARAIVPIHGSRGGHPVLMPTAAREVILRAAPPANLRHVLADTGALRVEVGTDSVLADIDTPADLEDLARQYDSDT